MRKYIFIIICRNSRRYTLGDNQLARTSGVLEQTNDRTVARLVKFLVIRGYRRREAGSRGQTSSLLLRSWTQTSSRWYRKGEKGTSLISRKSDTKPACARNLHINGSCCCCCNRDVEWKREFLRRFQSFSRETTAFSEMCSVARVKRMFRDAAPFLFLMLPR